MYRGDRFHRCWWFWCHNQIFMGVLGYATCLQSYVHLICYMHPLRKHTHLLSNIIQKSPTNEKTKILTYDWSKTSKKERIKQILFLPKCLVVATRFPVGTSFDIEWLVSVAGGLCTVSTTGITTAGAPFSECATWIVLADRNREKPGDIHLEENILTRIFKPERCKISAKRLF